LGVFTVLYQNLPLAAALDKIAALGLEAVELGTGNYPGNHHCDPEALLADSDALDRFREAIGSRGLSISALSQHGNPLHPDPARAEAAHQVWRQTLELAERLEVGVVNAFPVCPGGPDGGQYPNWVTCAWPPEYLELLDWQWDEKIIPYWVAEAEQAARHEVKVGIEMHPGMPVYNPETLCRLRDAAGPAIACNFDPSHLFWQGIDLVTAIRELGRTAEIVHVDAKDTFVDTENVRRNGVVDAKPYGRYLDRSWTFRTIGYGHGEQEWRSMVSALRMIGYDGTISIEHEDGLMSVDEGLAKAVRALGGALLKEPASPVFWA
jgi:sugar phosphate isomerase/epimerase